MSLARSESNYVSREEYRRWCDAQPTGRYERDEGEIVAMAPERVAHVRMKGAVYRALYRAVAAVGVPCEVLSDGVTVETGDSDYEPDTTVNCGTPMADDDIAASNPVIVVEVLPPRTSGVDTGAKLAGYFRVPSIMHYLIVHPAKRSVIHHRRVADGIATRIVADGPVEMAPPGITIEVDELYGVRPEQA